MRKWHCLHHALVAVVILSISLAALAACTSAPNSPAATISVKDGLGREVKIPAQVQRIVSTYGIATHFVYALGAGDKLVGVDAPSKKKTDSFFARLDPNFMNLPAPGSPGEANLEEIIGLKPDLVLVPGRNKQMVDQLSGKGLTVFGVVAENLQQVQDTMDILGKALGKEDVSRRFDEYYQHVLETVGSKTRALPADGRPKVYLAGPQGFLSTCSGEMYQSSLIDLAGGRNVAAQQTGGWVEVSPEQVLAWNPDVILVVRYQMETTPEKILSDSRWQSLTAVKDKRVFWFPSELNPWDYPSPQAALGVVWLAKTLHPDTFPSLDPQQEAEWFFRQFYGRGFAELGGSL